MTLEEILRVPTAATSQDLADDLWDEDNRLSYSADGEKLLDAENFPSEVTVREGCRILCDGVFACQDYMAEDRRIGEEIPLDERNSFLEKIHLPASLTHIGSEAFRECGMMTSIKLPGNLLYIGEGAFCDCWQLEKLRIPSSVRYIGPRAFQGCINLYQIRFGKNIEFIGEDAFDDCESLETIFIPRGMLDSFLGLLPKELHELIEEL